MPIFHGWKSFPTWLIMDAIDSAEYVALSATNKDIVRIIISSGLVNLIENSVTWNRLHDIFPDGTISWAAIKTASEYYYNESTTP